MDVEHADGTKDLGEAVADIDNLLEFIWRARGVVANALELSILHQKCYHIDL